MVTVGLGVKVRIQTFIFDFIYMKLNEIEPCNKQAVLSAHFDFI